MTEEIRFYRAVGPYGFLSNLYRQPLFFEGRFFRSAEDAYQYGKPRKTEVADWLVAAPSPHLCAAAAHALFAFDVRPDWNQIKLERMRQVLRAKFTQHRELKLSLLQTGDARLIEESATDAFWGIGKTRKGKNMLGVLLMEIRQELREEKDGR
ncbi:MAG: NADAR family protein [Bacillota bacterium]|nr:MAG: NADAR family protein [Bacillota bacterium]